MKFPDGLEGQELLYVLRLLINSVFCTEKKFIISTSKVKGKHLYWYILNMLKEEGNYEVKLFSLSFLGVPK